MMNYTAYRYAVKQSLCRRRRKRRAASLCEDFFESLHHLLAARRYGVEDQVIASLDGTFLSFDWEKHVGYLISRMIEHGRRRAAEMRESAETVAAIGLEPLMTLATPRRQDWLADRIAENPSLKAVPEADWRARLDQILGRLKSAKTAAE